MIEALALPPEITAALAGAANLDQMEVAMADPNFQQVECPVTHEFVPGLYIREIFIPAGTLLVTGTHRQQHPFRVEVGIARVWSEQEGFVEYAAPHKGITQPGTRRLLYAVTDVVWTTFHPTDKCTVEEVLADVLEPHSNPGLPPDFVPGFLRDLSKNLTETPPP